MRVVSTVVVIAWWAFWLWLMFPLGSIVMCDRFGWCEMLPRLAP